MTVYSNGSSYYTGTVSISTPDELERFGNSVNSGAIYTGVTVELENDIDMSGVEWEPIGGYFSDNQVTNFNSIFDGKGHKVTNVNIVSPHIITSSYSPANAYAGFFGYLQKDGEIKDLGVEISINFDTQAMVYAGGMTAANFGKITNCYVTGSINFSSTLPSTAGGIAANNSITGYTGGRISNCYSRVGIVNNAGIHAYTGGIAGSNYYEVSNCYYLEGTATGGINGSDVTGQAEVKSDYSFAGGEVTYLLQGQQETQVWGQDIGVDEYPVLTGDSAKAVSHKVTFYAGSEESGYSEYAVAYANHNGNTILPYDDPAMENMIFTWWAADKAGDNRFTGNTVVTEDRAVYSYFIESFAGNGTEESPYIINDLADLEDFARYANTRDSGAQGEYFKVTNDIDMTTKYNEKGLSWTPVGNRDVNFEGVFDGNGHEIKVYVNTTDTRQGLFGITGESSIIKNLSVSGSVTSAEYAGGITGICYGRIENCSSSVVVTSSAYGAGGIVGSNAGTVVNCYSTGNVTGTSETGGITGRGNETGIINCYYLAGTATGGINSADSTGHAEAKTTDEFADGQVTYLLNDSVNSGSNIWKQTLGSDSYPIFEGPDVVGFTKGRDDTMHYVNETTDGSITISNPDMGVFSIVVDTAEFGGEGAKYLDAVNVIVDDKAGEQIENYVYTDDSEQYAEFTVNYEASAEHIIRAEVEARDGEAGEVMYYVTKVVTAPIYTREE